MLKSLSQTVPITEQSNPLTTRIDMADAGEISRLLNLGEQEIFGNSMNSLGILDFVVAFTTATICAMTIAADTTPTIIGMGKLPLALIPTFMVPLFAMLHIVALMQARARR